MNTVRFWVLILPSVISVNAAVLTSIGFLSSWNQNIPELVKAVVFTGVMKLLLMTLDHISVSFKIPDCHVFRTHISPVIYELIKVGLVGFIALHSFNESWHFRLSTIQFFFIAATYMTWNLVEFVVDFSPRSYETKYKLFLKLYEDFYYMENYEDDSRTDVTLQVVECLQNDMVAGDTLAEVLPRKISICSRQEQEQEQQEEEQHQEHHESNSPKFKTSYGLSTHASMPDLGPDLRSMPSKSLTKYKSCYDMVDKLYSVSPKNTYHLVTASATAVPREEFGSFCPPSPKISPDISFNEEDDTLSVESSISASMPGPITIITEGPESDSGSVHSTDTHLGGGGGGNFKYKFPDGSKLKFGGGAGFDYKRKHKHHSSRSCSKSSKATTLTNSSSFTDSSDHHQFHPRSLFNWLIPTHKKDPSIKKKLSQFHLTGPQAHKAPLLSSSSVSNYHSIEPESHSESPRSVNKYEFNNYIRLSLGLDPFKIKCDPIFTQFGHKLIRDLSWAEILLYHVDWVVWEIGTLLLFSLQYLNKDFSACRAMVGIVVILILKLFNGNVIIAMNMSMIRVLVCKMIITGAVMCIIVI